MTARYGRVEPREVLSHRNGGGVHIRINNALDQIPPGSLDSLCPCLEWQRDNGRR